MPPSPLPTHFLQVTTLARVLVDQYSGTGFGYCFGCGRPGPDALSATWSPFDAVSQRLITLPTLTRMWGHLYLIALDRLRDDHRSNVAHCIPNLTFDDAYIFADSDAETLGYSDFNEGYWAVLRMCAGLGMFQGRGVTAQYG